MSFSRKFAKLVLVLVPTLTVLLGFSASSPGANWQSAAGVVSGNWNDATHWSTADVPDTSTETATFPVITFAPGPHVIGLNDAMYPSGLTTRRFELITSGISISQSRFYQVNAVGSSGTLDWTMGDAVNFGSLFIDRHALSLNNVNLEFLGTVSSGNTIFLQRVANGVPTHNWNIDAVNSTIRVAAAPVGGDATAGLGLVNGAMRMQGGELEITNGGGTARIQVQGIDTTHPLTPGAYLRLVGTQLTTNQLHVIQGGRFDFDGTGVVGSNTISGLLNVAAGEMNMEGGTLTAGSIVLAAPGTSLTGKINVTGGSLISTSTLDNKSTGATPTGAFPSELNVSGGSVSATAMDFGGSSTEKGAFAINLSGTGSLAVTGALTLGYDDSTARHGAGTMAMTGGSLTAAQLKVGAAIGVTPNSVGYYSQTGGSSTFGTVVFSRDALSPLGYGTEEFVVGAGATMKITGAGFSTIGNGAWHLGDDAGDLDFSGTLVFDPATPTPQTLLAFGADQGETLFFSSQAIAAHVAANYGIGTLDLTALDGTETLQILPAGNSVDNALYVNSLLGLSAAEVTSHLDSVINIYYNAGQSPDLLGQTFQLNAGGELIAMIAVPEPSTLLLTALASIIGLPVRRRRQGR